MLITHHPLIFSGIKKVTDEDFIGRRLVRLLQNDVSYYAMHTNYDVLSMAKSAAERMGMTECEVLEKTKEDPDNREGFWDRSHWICRKADGKKTVRNIKICI